MAADFDAIDADIEADKKDLQDGLKRKVEAVKKGIKDRKDDLRQRVEAAKTGAKDRLGKEAEQLRQEKVKSVKADSQIKNMKIRKFKQQLIKAWQ